MGFSDGPKVTEALAVVGVVASGYKWLWRPGDADGIFPPHKALNGRRSKTIQDDSFDGRLPGTDVNGHHCRCDIVVAYRDALGRFR